jgi:hypothetical protein
MPNIILSEYDKKVRDGLMEACDGNRKAQWAIKAEAFSTADFPVAFQKVNQLVMQARLAEYTPVWTSVAKRVAMDNLKLARSMRLDIDTTNLPANNGGVPRIPGTLPRIPEGTEYPGFGFTASEYEFGTAKNGGRIAFTWESFQNDDWGQIADLPNQMVELAVNTEETEIFRQYYSLAGGFNPQMFVAAQNLNTTGVYTGGTINPALSLNSLQAARAAAVQPPPTPAGNRPRLNTNNRWALLVPASLEATANQILGITQIKTTDAQGNEYLTTPQLGGITVVVVPWINYLTAGGNYAQTTGWALVPFGGESIYGETVIGATLRGRETPQMRIKNDQGQALGGGALSPYEGDFDADSIQIRIAQWFKGNAVSNFGCIWSKGTGAGNNTP